MACDSITPQLVSESGRIGEEIFTLQFQNSPVLSLQPRAVFPKSMGQSINVLTIERTAPTEANPTWTDMTFSETVPAEGGICLPPATVVNTGSTLRSYNLARIHVQSQDFCAEELRPTFETAQQLDAILGSLSEYVRILWEIRFRQEYFRMVQRKVVVTSSGLQQTDTMASSYPAYCPGSFLSQGVLNRLKMHLLRNGAGKSALGVEDGMPIFTLITDAETSDNIIKINEPRRQDLRWGKPNELLRPFGVERSYMGFYHLIDPFPRRFTCEGDGTFTEVAPFVNSAATKGIKSEINPDWEAAPYTESFIYSRSVYTQMIPEPVISPGGRQHFDPVKYTGDWEYLNIKDRVCNPRGLIGFYDGILASGSRPERPQDGVAIVHLRCDPSLELITSCSNSNS